MFIFSIYYRLWWSIQSVSALVKSQGSFVTSRLFDAYNFLSNSRYFESLQIAQGIQEGSQIHAGVELLLDEEMGFW